MNCTIIQRRLLGAEDPAHPPDEVQAHLDGCPCCREWQHVLLQLEQQVPLLPVPASDSRAEFLQRLLHTPAAGTVNGTGPPLKIRVPELVRQRAQPVGPRPLSAALRHWMPLAGVAAALLLIVIGWRELVPQPQRGAVAAAKPAGPDPLVASVMAYHLRLVREPRANVRTEVLVALHRDLVRETQNLRHTPDSQKVVQTLESLQDLVMKSLRGPTPPNFLAAGHSTPSPATVERMLQLQQNQLVLTKVVTNCVQLADKDDPLERAAGCKDLVKQLAEEITEAANQGQPGRAVEMSDHLCAVLEQGVAGNLNAYRETKPLVGSVMQRNLAEAGTWAVEASKDLEEQLAVSNSPEVRRARKKIQDRCDLVEKALKFNI